MATTPSETPPDVIDEMHDSIDDWDRADALGLFLKTCDPRPRLKVDPNNPPASPSLREAFDEADERAKDGQMKFRRLTRRAAWLGLGAFLLMILHLAIGESAFETLAEKASHHVPQRLADSLLFLIPLFETGLALASCIYVVIGLLKFRHEEWLVERFKAERHRLLKFRLLIDPQTWTRDHLGTEEWTQELRHEVQRIRALTHFDKDEIGLGQDVPKLAPATLWSSQALDPSSPLLGDIVSYYRRRRLDSQISYFLDKGKTEVPIVGNRRLSPLLFFFGVACVFVTFVLELVKEVLRFLKYSPQPVLHVFIAFFVILAGSAPAVSAALRTIRAAYEWERNAERSRAMHATLSKIGNNLYTEQCSRPATPQNMFAYLSLSEFALAADQREWVRLMGEAEWYG